MQAHPCCHGVRLQRHGGLGRGQPIPGHERDQLTIGFGKAPDCVDQRLVLVAVDDDIGGVRVLFVNGTEKQSAQALPSPFPPPMIEQHVAGDPVQPRSEVIVPRHLVATSPHDQEHLRGHIRSVGRTTGSS